MPVIFEYSAHLAHGLQLVRIVMEGIRAGYHVKIAPTKGQVLSVSDHKSHARTLDADLISFALGVSDHIVGHIQPGNLHRQSGSHALGQESPRPTAYIQYAKDILVLGCLLADFREH